MSSHWRRAWARGCAPGRKVVVASQPGMYALYLRLDSAVTCKKAALSSVTNLLEAFPPSILLVLGYPLSAYEMVCKQPCARLGWHLGESKKDPLGARRRKSKVLRLPARITSRRTAKPSPAPAAKGLGRGQKERKKKKK